MQFNEPNYLQLSKLAIAAYLGIESDVDRLLQEGSRIDLADNRGWNAIHQAAANNHVGCVKLLVRKGPQHVNRRTMEGETPLLLACKNERNMKIIEVLIENGADVNLGDNEDFVPLHFACMSGSLEIAELLVRAGARISVRNFNNWTPLHFAVSSNSEEVRRNLGLNPGVVLQQTMPSTLNHRNHIRAIQGRGGWKVFRKLWHQEICRKISGKIEILKHADIVKFLLAKGADVTIKDECGRTPLFLACETCDLNIVKPLLEFDKNVNVRAKDKASALMLAAQCGSLEVVQELLNRGADPNVIASDKTMALHLAVHAGAVDVVQLLLKVTSKDAILAASKVKRRLRMKEINNSLCCLAIDSESFEVLQALVASDLGSYILNLPIHTSPRISMSDFLLGRPKSLDFHFMCLPPITFLLQTKFRDMKEDVIKYLEFLLEHNFPVNTTDETELPPLVGLLDQDEDNETVMRCVDILIAHGADIDYTIKDFKIPEALRSVCVSAKCTMLMKLLNMGSSGSPDDLLDYLRENDYLDVPEDKGMTKMVTLLLELGVTSPDVFGRLLTYYHSPEGENFRKELSKPLGEFQLCSLQKLSRAAVRKHLRLPLSKSLDKLPVPNSVKDYLLYKLQ